jgi:integrase
MAESRPRRGHSEDSMYFDRAHNYWVAAVSLGYKAGKRVRRKVTGRTKTEVKAKLRELRRDLDSGITPSATYTVGAALDDWLANGLSRRSDRTKELYQDTVTGRPSKSLTLEQAQELLRAAGGSRLYAYVVLSVTTGLRTEELRALGE